MSRPWRARCRRCLAGGRRGGRRLRPGAVVALRPDGRHREAVAGAPQRHRPGPAQDVAVDHQRRAMPGRRARGSPPRQPGGNPPRTPRPSAPARSERPSARRPMQPAGSHRIPAPRLGSVCARASRIGGEPLPCGEGVAAAAGDRRGVHRRRARRSVSPSAAIRTSGCGVRAAHRLATASSATPVDAQRRFEQAQHHQPGAAEQQRADAERRHAADRARQARDPERDRDHPVDALVPSATRAKPSNPNGIDTTPRMPIGMVQPDTTGIASRFAITP